jgi:predicted alpha/beta hydrolase family esterase
MHELALKNIPAYSLLMPNTQNPVAREWVAEIDKQIDNDSEDVILVGHSLGVSAILRYLEKFPTRRFKGAVFVSGFVEKLEVDNPESVFRKIDDFVDPAIIFHDIRKTAQKFVVIHGEKDTIVPLVYTEQIVQGLGAELVVVKDGDHFSQKTQPICYELPPVLESILNIINLTPNP